MPFARNISTPICTCTRLSFIDEDTQQPVLVDEKAKLDNNCTGWVFNSTKSKDKNFEILNIHIITLHVHVQYTASAVRISWFIFSFLECGGSFRA